MNKAKIAALVSTILILGGLCGSFLANSQPTKTAATLDTEPSDPLHGIVYYKNPVSGKLALYVSYELEPEHEYSFQITDDGVTFSEIFHKSMKGVTHEIYESFNVPDPCNGIWPRVLDVTPH